MPPKPLYRLKELMIKKYGEEKFAVACSIVALWVQGETKQKTTAKTILGWCNKTEIDQMPIMCLKDFKAISKLFSLNNDIDNFYTN